VQLVENLSDLLRLEKLGLVGDQHAEFRFVNVLLQLGLIKASSVKTQQEALDGCESSLEIVLVAEALLDLGEDFLCKVIG
jgi:hypothetical protein